eukprot:TRINITY_DN100850_c0_g1_i1.p1 TRINITY_DN100850_c0_g1~~TRINITY_DN100850_c0_g1_i1.p1  ORF type:complete len:477 (+),score=96.37 TRINITY_DN100850_c0_g1_i1:137-1567(+)
MAADKEDDVEGGVEDDEGVRPEDLFQFLCGEDANAAASSAPPIITDVEEHLSWRTNAVVLYDLFLCCTLEWPALSVAWLPDEDGQNCRLVVGTHTDANSRGEARVLVLQLSCDAVSRLENDPWMSWEADGVSELEGFGCEALDGRGPLYVTRELRHPTEVNRLAPCPHQPSLLASRAATGAVLLYDCKRDLEADEDAWPIGDPEASMVAAGAECDGFALCWSRMDRNLLATGGNDGRLCVWDTAAALKGPRATSPLVNFKAHNGALCDASYSSSSPCMLATVGDKDRLLQLWDLRCHLKGAAPDAVPKAQSHVVASDDEVLSVDWSYKREWQVATAGKQQTVRIWDMRSLKTPCQSLRGHDADTVAVRWAPFREDLLATAAEDSKAIIWDLSAKEVDDPEAEAPPELLFSHRGHGKGHAVSDISWGPDDFLMSSVSSDNIMQVWQPSALFYLDDSEDEDGGQESAPSAAKRPRHGA